MDNVALKVSAVASLVKKLSASINKSKYPKEFLVVAQNVLASYYDICDEPQASVFRRKVADTILLENPFAESLVNGLETCLKVFNQKLVNDQSSIADGLRVAGLLQAVVLNYSDCSSRLCYTFLKNDKYINCNKTILENTDIRHLKRDKDRFYLIKCSLNCAYNFLKYRGQEARYVFNKANYISSIKRYQNSEFIDVKCLSSIILAYLVDEEQVETLITDEILEYILTSLKNTLFEDTNRSTGFNAIELCLTLQELVLNESVCERILQNGLLPLLKYMFGTGTMKQRCAASYVLWTLSCNPISRQEIKKAFGSIFTKDLYSLHGDQDDSNGRFDFIELKSWLLESIYLYAEGKGENQNKWIRNILRSIATEMALNDHVPPEDLISKKSHLMISYNHADKKNAELIKSTAKMNGFEVWIDTEKMVYEDGIFDGMAKAIENAFAVCILYSDGYKRSSNTKAEALYAHKIEKPLIFCRVDATYTPDGWLGILLLDKMYIDFPGKHPFEKAQEQLLQLLRYYSGDLDKFDKPRSSKG